MKKILILQNKILHYRIPLFNELSKYYEVTVMHSGQKISSSYDVLFEEKVSSFFKLGPFFIQNQVIGEVKKDRYDVIIAMFDLRWINNILSLYCHNKETKYILWGAWFTQNRIANFFRLYLTKKCKASIFYTKDAMNDFIKNGCDKDKLFVANNTFDVGTRIKSYEHEVKSRILFVGSLDKRKQVEILIQAFSKIDKYINNSIVLTVIGQGDEMSQLENLVYELKLSNKVHFLGKITDTELLKNYYKESIVSVSFGQAGLSVLQSLGYGVPFITKDNAISGGEKSNIIDGFNGYFCKDSIDSLSEKLVEICNNELLYRTLGKNSYDYYSEHCTIENMTQGFIDAIENIRLEK